MENEDADHKTRVHKRKSGSSLNCMLAMAILSSLAVLYLLAFITVFTHANFKNNKTKAKRVVHFISVPVSMGSINDDQTSPRPCLTRECVKLSSHILSKMDLSVDPCEDMYLYACGGMHAGTRLPQTTKITKYAETDERFYLNLKRILSSNDTELFGRNSSAVAKMRSFYHACMDEKTPKRNFSSMIIPIISDLGSCTLSNVGIVPFDHTTWSLQGTLTKLHKMGFNFLFSVKTVNVYDAETKQVTKDVLHFVQDDRSKFIATFLMGPIFRTVVAYNIARRARLMGARNPAALSPKVMSMFAFLDSLEFRNYSLTADNITLGMLQQQIGPLLDVQQYLREVVGGGAAISLDTKIYCPSLAYFTSLGMALRQFDSEVIANVLMIQFLEEMSDYLTRSSKPPPTAMREASCMKNMLVFFSPPLTALFGQHFLKPETLTKVNSIGENIRKELIQTLEGVNWFDEHLKAALIRKAQAVKLELGYPDWILDPVHLDKVYQNVSVDPEELFVSALKFRSESVRQKIEHKPGEPFIGWQLIPERYESYTPRDHTIHFTASVLQSPAFSLHMPTSMQYGGFGSTFGHEIMHGFDNRHIVYDVNYALEPSWTSDVNDTYMEGVNCLVDVYSSLSHDDVQANGYASVIEDVCDNEGLKLTYRAYKALGELDEPRLPGLDLTDDQMFFVAFSQRTCTIDVNGKASQSSTHNDMRIRLWGTLGNSEEFSQAFNCTPDAPMNAHKKCYIF